MDSKQLQALREYREKINSGEIEAPIRKTPWEKLAEKPTLKRAVTAKCYECMGWEKDSDRPVGITSDIAGCTAESCPLWQYRPHKK